MTYVLAWKTDSEVFLTADSALTTTHPSPEGHHLERSSFGEEHIFENDRIVEERALKLFLKDNIGVAIAGRYDTAIQIVKSFYEGLSAGSSPKRALDDAIFHWYPSLRDGIVQLAVAYFDERPQLLYFDGQNRVDDTRRIVHLGSAPPDYQAINEQWLEGLVGVPGFESSSRLAAMQGVLQSHGILNTTLQRGIGGAFAGLYVDDSGGHWQSDLLFIEDGTTRFVSSCVRRDCFIINSPVLGESRCFLTYLPPKTEEELREQTSRAIAEAVESKRSAVYDYAFIMNTSVRSLTLVHMNKNLRHRLLWIEPSPAEEGSTTTIRIYPALRDVLNRTTQGMVTISYKSPDETEIPEDRILRRDIRPEN
jgi:hypothetical protein